MSILQQEIYLSKFDFLDFFRFFKFINFLLEEALKPSSQGTIAEAFKKQSGPVEESFTINHFKRLLLSFIVSNNLSFKCVITLSFIKLLKYLN